MIKKEKNYRNPKKIRWKKWIEKKNARDTKQKRKKNAGNETKNEVMFLSRKHKQTMIKKPKKKHFYVGKNLTNREATISITVEQRKKP